MESKKNKKEINQCPGVLSLTGHEGPYKHLMGIYVQVRIFNNSPCYRLLGDGEYGDPVYLYQCPNKEWCIGVLAEKQIQKAAGCSNNHSDDFDAPRGFILSIEHVAVSSPLEVRAAAQRLAWNKDLSAHNRPAEQRVNSVNHMSVSGWEYFHQDRWIADKNIAVGIPDDKQMRQALLSFVSFNEVQTRSRRLVDARWTPAKVHSVQAIRMDGCSDNKYRGLNGLYTKRADAAAVYELERPFDGHKSICLYRSSKNGRWYIGPRAHMRRNVGWLASVEAHLPSPLAATQLGGWKSYSQKHCTWTKQPSMRATDASKERSSPASKTEQRRPASWLTHVAKHVTSLRPANSPMGSHRGRRRRRSTPVRNVPVKSAPVQKTGPCSARSPEQKALSVGEGAETGERSMGDEAVLNGGNGAVVTDAAAPVWQAEVERSKRLEALVNKNHTDTLRYMSEECSSSSSSTTSSATGSAATNCVSIHEAEKTNCVSIHEAEKTNCVSIHEAEKTNCVSIHEAEKTNCVTIHEAEKTDCVSIHEAEKNFQQRHDRAESALKARLVNDDSHRSTSAPRFYEQVEALKRERQGLARDIRTLRLVREQQQAWARDAIARVAEMTTELRQAKAREDFGRMEDLERQIKSRRAAIASAKSPRAVVMANRHTGGAGAWVSVAAVGRLVARYEGQRNQIGSLRAEVSALEDRAKSLYRERQSLLTATQFWVTAGGFPASLRDLSLSTRESVGDLSSREPVGDDSAGTDPGGPNADSGTDGAVAKSGDEAMTALLPSTPTALPSSTPTALPPSTPTPPPPPTPARRTFANSLFRDVYRHTTLAPKFQHQLFGAVYKLIRAFARRHDIPRAHCDDLFARLQLESFKQPTELRDGQVHHMMERLWTSTQRLKPAPRNAETKGKELCFIINDAIRRDAAAEVVHVAMVARSLNKFCVARPRQQPDSAAVAPAADEPPYPPDGVTWRGTSFRDIFKPFFVCGRWFRTPGFCATSFSRRKAEQFLSWADSRHPVVLWCIATTRQCNHVNYITKRAPRLADEKEYLYAPYSCFMITKVQWSPTPLDKNNPHRIWLRAATDNKQHPENLSLTPWY